MTDSAAANDGSVYWFGEPWPSANARASVCEDDRRRVEPPVGRPCIWCSEPIHGLDRGVTMRSVTLDGDVTREPMHLRCLLGHVTGDRIAADLSLAVEAQP